MCIRDSYCSEIRQWKSRKLLGIYVSQVIIANACLGFGHPPQFLGGEQKMVVLGKNLNMILNWWLAEPPWEWILMHLTTNKLQKALHRQASDFGLWKYLLLSMFNLEYLVVVCVSWIWSLACWVRRRPMTFGRCAKQREFTWDASRLGRQTCCLSTVCRVTVITTSLACSAPSSSLTRSVCCPPLLCLLFLLE